MIRIVNLTPHAIVILRPSAVRDSGRGLVVAEGTALSSAIVATIPPAGTVARVAVSEIDEGDVIPASPGPECPPEGTPGYCAVTPEGCAVCPHGVPEIPVRRQVYGDIEGLPAPSPGTYYVVSRVVAEAARTTLRGTMDLLVPAGLVRDEGGRVVGCTHLARV